MNELQTLIEYLKDHSVVGWQDILSNNFSEAEATKQKVKIETLASKLGASIYGIVPASTNIILDVFPSILPSVATQLWEQAKSYNLVHQVGRGKGKCLVLFNVELPETTTVSSTSVDATDGVALAKALREIVGEYVADIERLQELLILNQKLVAEKQEIIESLQQQLNTYHKTTWS